MGESARALIRGQWRFGDLAIRRRIFRRKLVIDALGMLRQPEPGLRHRGPQRPVAFFRRRFGHAQAILGIGAIVVDGTHVTIPLTRITPEPRQSSEMGKVGMALRRDRGHFATALMRGQGVVALHSPDHFVWTEMAQLIERIVLPPP